jgi:hypothetical protein
MIIPYFHEQMIGTNDANYGGWAISNGCLHLYVESGLEVNKNARHLFSRRDDDFVGHCILSFIEVQSFIAKVSLYHPNENFIGAFNGRKVEIREKITDEREELTEYVAAGALYRPYGWTDWTIFAKSFELIIL